MLKLLAVSSDKSRRDPKNTSIGCPTSWDAVYQVNHSSDGRAFWFEVTVKQDSSGSCAASATLDITERPDVKSALLKLAEWARMLAAGIEGSALPTVGFPVVIPNLPVEVQPKVTEIALSGLRKSCLDALKLCDGPNELVAGKATLGELAQDVLDVIGDADAVVWAEPKRPATLSYHKCSPHEVVELQQLCLTALHKVEQGDPMPVSDLARAVLDLLSRGPK